VSSDQVAELTERLSEVRCDVARILERQTIVMDLLEKSQASLIEREAHTIKTKLWLVAMVAGAVCSTAWELVKARLFPSH
jgi:hypothetical protein